MDEPQEPQEPHDYRVRCVTNGDVKAEAIRFDPDDPDNVAAVADFAQSFVDRAGNPPFASYATGGDKIIVSWADGTAVVREDDRVVRVGVGHPDSALLVLSDAQFFMLFAPDLTPPEVH